jgi:putative membrane protein
MSKSRLQFTALVAACCLGLMTFGVAQDNNQASSSQSEMSSQQGANSSSQVSSSSKKFLDHMAKDSQGEVQIAQMVESKTSNPQVKQFAQKLEQDHTQMDQQMQSTMSQLGMTMPQPLTAQQQQLQSKLQSASGTQFDKDFVNAQVQDHQKDVSEVQQHLKSVTDENVKQLLQQALPVLQQHLQMAKQLQSQLGSGSQQSASTQQH